MTAMSPERAELIDLICIREARRREILDWLQEEIGTGWTCDNCGYSTYHSNANECADCGTPFPLEHLLAFKLHATGTKDVEAIAFVRAELEAEGIITASDGKDRIAELEAEREWIGPYNSAAAALALERNRAERAEAELASLRAAPSAEAIREAVIEECAQVAYNIPDHVKIEADGSWSLSGPYDRGRFEAAAAIRSLRRARTTQENPNG